MTEKPDDEGAPQKWKWALENDVRSVVTLKARLIIGKLLDSWVTTDVYRRLNAKDRHAIPGG